MDFITALPKSDGARARHDSGSGVCVCIFQNMLCSFHARQMPLQKKQPEEAARGFMKHVVKLWGF